MQIISDFTKDTQTPKPNPGAYEWWYFDAIDKSGRYKFVIIFYEGNPFSPSYIKEIKSKPGVTADQYPAISISIYEEDAPIYYSFTEFEPGNCFFDGSKPEVKVGGHVMKGYKREGQIIYELHLDETLPSDDGLKAELEFSCRDSANSLFDKRTIEEQEHCWNLVQPYARVNGRLAISRGNSNPLSIDFSGNGYHDHNTGGEPMKEEFVDWYWGRFHFQDYTLVYYLMNRKEAQQYKAWLIERKRGSIAETFNEIHLTDKSLTLFGMRSARKIGIKNGRFKISVQQSSVLDSGPFYQRFGSEAFLHNYESGKSESARGISEYIYPDRIYSRLFWPLVNMRIYNKKKGAHWVQKSPRLYRWTW